MIMKLLGEYATSSKNLGFVRLGFGYLQYKKKVQVNYVGQENVRYLSKENEVIVAEVTRAAGSVEIPAQWEGKTVTGIAKKAFLGCLKMTELVLPSTIRTIEDYAFASCKSLVSISMPRQVESLGNRVFHDLRSVKQIVFSDAEESLADISYLCAIMTQELSMDDVNAFCFAGEDSWWERFDSSLLAFIKRLDEEGFSPFLAGGEEDYEDANNDINYYCRQRRIRKIICILERLLVEKNLSKDILDEYLMYLDSFVKKQMNNQNEDNEPDELTEVLLNGGQRTMNYYAMYEKYHLICQENIDQILAQIPDEQVELRGVLLKKKQEYGTESIWEELMLR